jgi:hypothetical protein
MLQQTHTTLSNGLQSFADASPEYELAPVGLGSMKDQAKKLAEYGRHGDIYFVHAAEGETVVPIEVLDANPKVKEMLFNQMREMGLDPEEFIVGNELNSLNPVTGMPEFFLGSVWRTVKKGVKKVAGFLKRAAPMIIPLAATMFGVPFLGPSFGAGTFGAAFVGGGLGTLAGGGSLKDSLKAGLISGGLTSLGSGLQHMGTDVGFTGGIKSSFTGATPVYLPNNISGQMERVGTRYAPSPGAHLVSEKAPWRASGGASADYFDDLFSRNPQKAFTSPGQWLGPDATRGNFGRGFVAADGFVPTTSQGRKAALIRGMERSRIPNGTQYAQATKTPVISGQQAVQNVSGQPSYVVVPAPSGAPAANLQQKGVIQQAAKDALAAERAKTPWWRLDKWGTGRPKITQSDVVAQLKSMNTDVAQKALQSSVNMGPILENINPGTLQTYGPAAAAGLGAAYGFGAFDEDKPDQPEEVDQITGSDLVEESRLDPDDPDYWKYYVPYLDPWQYTPGNPQVPSPYNTSSASLFAANGGMANAADFPRRDLLVEGPGTERSDDIPAMLSDGEFVMNSRSVRGADPTGQGNRYAGAQNLYNMMRNFEMRA